MTLTDEVKNGMEVSNPYCTNTQVVVVPKDQAEQYSTVESVKDVCGEESAESIETIINAVEKLSDGAYKIKFDISLVRGQGYYTGTVF